MASTNLSFSDINQTKLELVNTSPGDAILFHDRMLHAGSINHGKKTRISLEFTLIIPIKNECPFRVHVINLKFSRIF